MKEFTLESEKLSDYLRSDEYMDFQNPLVRGKAREIFAALSSETEKAAAAFEFVRDKIHHSGDIGSGKMPKTASEVLRHGEGICLGKSHLLAAFLRCAGIPAGLCYQRLTKGDTPDTGYVTHGLNAVFLENKWIRLDARGNKPGVDAQFSVDGERLAFPVRAECGEIDYPMIYFKVPEEIAGFLDKYGNYREYMAGETELPLKKIQK